MEESLVVEEESVMEEDKKNNFSEADSIKEGPRSSAEVCLPTNPASLLPLPAATLLLSPAFHHPCSLVTM